MASIADSIAASTSTGVSTMKASSPRTACNFPAASPSKALASAIAWRSLRTSASASGFMWTYNVNEPSWPLPPARKLILRLEDRQPGEAAGPIELQQPPETAQQLARQLPDKVAVRWHLAALVLPQPELLISLRQPLCLRPRALQRRMARAKVHVAEEPDRKS